MQLDASSRFKQGAPSLPDLVRGEHKYIWALSLGGGCQLASLWQSSECLLCVTSLPQSQSSPHPPPFPMALSRSPAKIPIPSRLAQEIQSQLETQRKQGAHRYLIGMKNVEAGSYLET